MPSLPTIVRVHGITLELNAFLDTLDVTRLLRTARSFTCMNVLHLSFEAFDVQESRVPIPICDYRWQGARPVVVGRWLRTLTLVNCGLRFQHWVEIRDAVHADGALEKLELLDISRNTLCASGCNIVAEALANNTSLVELNMADVGPGVVSIIGAVSTMRALTKLRIPKNALCTLEAGVIIGAMLESNSTLTEVDVSDNYEYGAGASYGAGFAQGFAHGVKHNGTLASVNIVNCDVGVEQAQNLAAILKEHATLKSLCGNGGHETDLDLSGAKMDAGCAIMMAPEIATNEWLTSLDLSNNRFEEYLDVRDDWIFDTIGIKDLAAAISQCKVLTSLDISNNRFGGYYNAYSGWISDMTGIKALAAAIPECKMLAKFTFDGGQYDSKPVTIDTSMTNADFSGKKLYTAGAIMLAAFLPKCRALVKLTFGGDKKSNGFGKYEEEEFESATLEVGMTDVDLSNKNLGAGGAILVGAWISHKDHGTIVKFNIGDNHIREEGTKAVAAALKGNKLLAELNISSNQMCWDDESGAIAIANAIPTMEGLVKFNISANDLRANGGKALADALKGNPILKELNIAGNNLGKDSSPCGGKTDMSGVIAIGNAIPTMGALTSLYMSNNKLATKEAGQALAGALAANSTLKELDVSNNYDRYEANDGPCFAKELAIGVSANGAIETLNISNNSMATKEAGKALADALAANSVLKELNVANNLDGFFGTNTDGSAFVQELANGVCYSTTKGAMTSLNISGNNIGQLVLPDGWEKDNGCFYGPDDEEQEEPPEGSSPAGIIAISNAIPTMRALTNLDISDNNIGGYYDDDDWISDMSGVKALAAAIPECKALTSLNISSNSLGRYSDGSKWISDMTGIKALAAAIPECRALVKLDISRNSIKGEALQRITELFGTKGIELNNESRSGSGSECESESDGDDNGDCDGDY